MPTTNPPTNPITDLGYGNAGGLNSYGTPGIGDYTIYPDGSPGTNLSDLVGGSLTGGGGTGDTVGGVDAPGGPGGSLTDVSGGLSGSATGGIGGAIDGTGGTTTPAPTPVGTTTTPTTTTPTPTTTPTIPAAAPTSFAPKNDNVADNVNQVASTGSRLMQRAAGIGAAVANSRGLINSSIAAQAAQKAALDVAVPIGSQQAAQNATYNQQGLQGEQQAALQQTQSQTQLAVEGSQSATSQDIAARQEAVASQGAFAQALLAASQSYNANVNAIMANPDLQTAARQAAVNAAATQRDADFTMIQRVYGVSLGGSGSTSGSSSTPTLAWAA